MRLEGIDKADIVRVELRGVTFFAFVLDRDQDGLEISVLERHKLPRGLPVTRATAHQVVGHWPQGTRRQPRRRRRTDHDPRALVSA
jgi:hypothetical protein